MFKTFLKCLKRRHIKPTKHVKWKHIHEKKTQTGQEKETRTDLP